MRAQKEIFGKKFGRLTAGDRLGSFVRCVCDCGGAAVVRTDRVLSGKTKSCGCIQKEMRAASKKPPTPKPKKPRRTKDEKRLYAVWAAMVQRCHNTKNPGYPHYGGRGIEVCLDWMDFRTFMADMGSGYRKGLWIERDDNNEGYDVTNCRWATPKQQSLNRKNTLRFANGATLTRVAAHHGIGYQAAYRVYARLAARANGAVLQVDFLAAFGTSMP